MIRKISILATCIVMGLALAAPASAVMMDQSFATGSNQGAQVGITYDGLAQTFTVGVNGTLDSAELMLSHGNATPLAALNVSLWTTALGAPNTVVASVNLAPGDVSAGPAYGAVLIDFSSAMLAVTIGDVLAISISSDDQYAWSAGVDGFATYAGGQRYSDSAGGLVSWSGVPTWDMSFRTFVDTGATVVPEPGTLALIGVAGLFFRRFKTGVA